ncbi:hypothetical protein ASC66_16150 [Leifsonia sp. Root4]|uniref:hypothetical protein n=1 Tax=Leifsonia sp. Root4 TaxID=1736525 RepID=UPI0006F8C47A|nr:hypothetical protein [Leifsonia sp. Root4]KQW04000.1 hypothetical protein ASC66_16150 [Leifsonia sp. Root4]
MDDEQRRAAAAIIDAALADAVLQLTAAGSRTEAIARFEPARRRALLFTAEPRMVPLGRVWRLGVFLLGIDGQLYATGHTTRAVDPRHPGYQSVSAEERRGYRAAAFRGPFERGETVNFDAERIALGEEPTSAASPLVVRDGQPFVRWSATASDDALRPFADYLAERVELLRG